jgi:transposase
LAEHAQKRMRRKIPQLVEGLTGRFTAHHAFLCRTMLDRIDEITTAIENLTARIDTEITPFQDLITLLDTIPGISAYLAQGILAEIGADMNRFTSPAHLASWAGMCPGNNESAGKHHSGRTRPGDMWLRGYLGEAALAAARTTTSYYHTRYQRIARRRGKKRALVAIAHALLTAIWHVLHDHLPHRDLGPDYYTQHTNPDRRRNRLITELHQLGYHVTLEKTAA